METELLKTTSMSHTPVLKSHKVIEAIAVLITFFALGSLYWPQVAGFFIRDIAPIDDADLMPKKIVVMDEDNAYLDMERLSQVAPSSDNDIKIQHVASGELSDPNEIARTISLYQPAFDVMDAMGKKKDFQAPNDADPALIDPPAPLGQTGEVRRLARARVKLDEYFAKSGHTDTAIGDIESMLALGDHMTRGQNDSAYFLTGNLVKKMSLEVIEKILPYATSTEDRTYLREALSQMGDGDAGAANVVRINYAFNKKRVNDLSEGRLHNDSGNPSGKDAAQVRMSKFYLEPNRTIAMFASMARANIANMNAPCTALSDEPKRIAAEAKALANSLPDRPDRMTRNWAGKALYAAVALDYTSTAKNKCEVTARVDRLKGELAGAIQ